MGGTMGKVALVALGALIGVAAIERAQNATDAAAEAVFEAINKAAQAASRYMLAMNRVVSSAAVEASEEVKRFVAQAFDAVKRAAACVSSRVVVLIRRLHGSLAASFAKRKLEGVDGILYSGDSYSLVASIMDDIRGFSSAPPEESFRQFRQSPTDIRAASSTRQIMEILDGFSFAVGEIIDLKVPTVAKVALSVIGVAAQLVFTVLE